MKKKTPTLSTFTPLAMRMRPRLLTEFIGQEHLLAANKPLWAAAQGQLHSMLFWGPPGCGKTTLARLLAQQSQANWITLSAVMSGVKDIRAAVETAQHSELPTVLFIDEIHRFNKNQQDALLPFVEAGTVTLIGATTENPSFEINNALLSRVRVYVLNSLTEQDLIAICSQALQDKERGLGEFKIHYEPALLEKIAQIADGDARNALNLLDVMFSLAQAHQKDGHYQFDATLLQQAMSGNLRRFDKQGDIFYDLISALHKSVRGSDPDAALYWFARMLDGGCDPLYIARRIVRMASEDIGNADPRALTIALNAWDVQERLGSPEGELTLAQAIIYMACAAKSNATYVAYNKVKEAVKKYGTQAVPLYLRNAPTQLMKDLGYAKEYRYAHNEPYAYATGMHYFPETMPKEQYYFPTDRGMEKQISEKLQFLKELDKKNK